MRKSVSAFKVNARGVRRDQHPTSFEKIFLEFVVESTDVEDADMRKAVKMSEESVCPVWAMIKNNVEVITEYKIIAS